MTVGEFIRYLLAFLLMLYMSVAPLYVGISDIHVRITCTEPITAVCRRLRKEINHRHNTYVCAEFEYTYLKKKYREDAVERLSRREEAHFKEGQTYTVYVNPKNPRYIRCTQKKWTWIDVYCILIGYHMVLSLILFFREILFG